MLYRMIAELTQTLLPLSLIPEFWISYLPDFVFPFNLTDLLRVLLIIPFLGYIGYKDYVSRKITERTWIPLLAIGIILLLHDFIYGPVIHFSGGEVLDVSNPFMFNLKLYGPFLLSNIVLAGIIGIVFNELDLFGGADLRAFAVIALFMPWWPNMPVMYPTQVSPPAWPIFFPPEVAVWNPFFLGVLQWTAVLGLFYPLKLFIQNQMSGETNNIIASFLGRPMKIPEFANNFGRTLYDKDGSITKDGFPSRFIREYIQWHNQHTDMEVETVTDLRDRKLFIGKFLDESDVWEVPTDEDGNWEDEELQLVETEFRNVLNQDEIWVMPEAPFLVPFSLGVLLASIIGGPMTLLFTFL